MRLPPRYAKLPIRLACLIPAILLVACSPDRPPAHSPSLRTAPPASGVQAIAGIPVSSPETGTPGTLKSDHTIVSRSIDACPPTLEDNAGPAIPPQTRHIRTGGTTLTLLTFDGRTHHLAVVDNERGPGTGATTSQAAAKASGSMAAINAGFFTPEGQPLGLVIEDSKSFGTLNSSSLGAGLYIHDPEARQTGLIRRTSWSRSAKPQQLLQSGPFLRVENRSAVSGLSRTRPRPRSFLLWNGHHGWAMGHATSITLAQLAATLASQPLPEFSIDSALNLDGGSSSDLWIAPSVNGGPASTRRFWNKPVRNYLVLQRHHP